MEGSGYTTATLAEYERLKQKYPNVGVCLQAYLKRTYADLQQLLPLEPKIRLVKGANLSMEKVEAELHGWAQAPYET